MSAWSNTIAGVALLASATLQPHLAKAQHVVKVGQGSYASYTPLINSRSSLHTPDAYGNTGDQSRYMQYRKLYVDERPGRPIPTNDWWTNLITQPFSGRLWSYPQLIQATASGLDIQRPSFWIDNGTEMKSNTVLSVGGDHFAPDSAVATDWHDWDVEFAIMDADKRMDVTMAHGMPFTWIELHGVEPIISLSNSLWTAANHNTGAPVEVLTADGQPLVSGTAVSALVMKKDGDAYGIFLPAGTEVSVNGQQVSLLFHQDKRYMVVACLNDVADMARLRPYAYTVPRDTKVSWHYDETAGKVSTCWDIDGESLNGGTTQWLQGFLPHQYRDTGHNPAFAFSGMTYATPHGELRMAAGNHFVIDYSFYGMLPYYALPNDTTGANAYLPARMTEMLHNYADNGTFGTDTYWGGKGLTQMALYMTFAREMGDTARFVQCRDRLKAALIDWYTYTPGERDRFFARYDRWGGLVGYSTSYDSDTFNDHHFHYGYFALASALLALVDDDFRDNYGQMARLLVKDYANWDRTDTAYPFFRTFDPWAGHSFAGGMGDDNGNGQESSSEAMQAWGGMYLLGVALDDKEMRDAGIFGWVSEARGTAEYWFDRHDDPAADYSVANYHQATTPGYNIPYSKFTSTYTQNGVQKTIIPPYNSNLTCHGVGWWTYFGWDAIYMQGIQWMPISPALDYLSENKAFAAWDYARLMQDKLIGGWHADSKTEQGYLGDSGGWGNVALSYLQRSDPDQAAAIFDACWQQGDKEFTQFSTNGITYFVTHSHRAHGDPDWSVTANCPTARAFDRDGMRTYQAYNPHREPLTVRFSDGHTATVAPRQLYVSDDPNRKALPILPPTVIETQVLDALGMENLALHKTCTVSGEENVGTVAQHATDGDDATRWGSLHQDGQWLSVDLGEPAKLYKLRLHWEAAYASIYTIELSDDGNTWHSGKTVSGDGGWDEVKMEGAQGRYIRITGNKRNTPYGISLYEIEAYGQKNSLGADDLLGIKVSADSDVLKQYAPARLSALGYTVSGEWTPVTVDWSTDDGTIDAEGIFTPAKFDLVQVQAHTNGITAKKTFAVEEAIIMQTFTVSPAEADIVVGGDSVVYEFGATDQFGGPFSLTGHSVSAEVMSRNTDGTLTPTDGAVYDDTCLKALRTGRYAIVFGSDGMRDTVYVNAKNFADYNLALNKPTEATSVNGGNIATWATDGKSDTRWESAWANATDDVTVDLRGTYRLNQVKVLWEGAAAKNYDIQVSTDGSSFITATTAHATGSGWTVTPLALPDGTLPTARFVRLHCTEKWLPAYGYSLYELEVYGVAKIDDQTTRIARPNRDAEDGTWYDLTGKRVPRPTSSKKIRGVYINSGNKYVNP